jgi:hypothetical protein
MARDSRNSSSPVGLPAGEYRLRLALCDPDSTGPDQRVFDVAINGDSAMDHYSFDAEPARFLRVLCHGNSENDWNSLWEAEVDGLVTGRGRVAVSASSAVGGFPAELAADGKLATRWAARGTNEWIQFRLAPGAIARGIGLQWYAADQRQARFEIQVSNDGRAWKAVTNLRHSAPSSRVNDRVDIFRIAGEPVKIVERAYDVKAGRAGSVQLTLAPVRGKLRICGVAIEPISIRSAAKGTEGN